MTLSGSHRISMAGFGNVGQAVAGLIAEGHPAASGIAITGVSDPRFGTVVSDSPIDASRLLADAAAGTFAGHPGHIAGAGVLEMIDSAVADTLVELTFTDLDTGEPATTHLRRALEAGMNVSTTNKGPIALNYAELRELASSKGVSLAFEGTVMSGTPVIEIAKIVSGAGCTAVVGILNGTTNYIVTRMEAGAAYAEALAEAQHLGYAEADPSGDVDGHDSAAKLAILAQLIAGQRIPVGEIERVPLSTVSSEDIAAAGAVGDRWRYIARLEETDGDWRAAVTPLRLPIGDPLAAVTGATNAITFRTDLLGDVTLSGPGAGRAETAFAVISDLRQLERGER